MSDRRLAAVEHAMRELVATQEVLGDFATATPLGSITESVAAVSAPVSVRWPAVGLTGGEVWLQVRETVTYAVVPGEVLQHLLRWVDDYSRRWDCGGTR